MKNFSTVLALAAAFLLPALSSAHTPSEIYGHVMEADPGVALVHAQVVLHAAGLAGVAVYTDDNGDFDTGSIPSGAYHLDFSMPGYTSVHGVSVTAAPGVPSEINQELQPSAGLL